MLVWGLFVCLLGWSAGRIDHGVDLPTRRPLIIGHRGASGALPEHTLEGYRLAIEQGADAIECDVTLTKDLVPICRHEGYLKAQTNVMDFPDFRARQKTYYIPDLGANYTDVHAIDMTLSEIKQLRVKQKYDFRNPNFDFQFQIPTLEEYIGVAKNAKRRVGIYPEIKDPVWLNSMDIVKKDGRKFEDIVVSVLHKHGYRKQTDPCFVQCFDEAVLKRLSRITELPLVWLLWYQLGDYWRTDNEKLREISEFCYGIGPVKNLIIPVDDSTGYLKTPTDLVERAHSFGLKVHAYTFQNENKFLAWNYTQDPYNEYQKFVNLGVDGFFTDFPSTLHNYLKMRPRKCKPWRSTDYRRG